MTEACEQLQPVFHNRRSQGNGKPAHQTPPERASEARKMQDSQKKKKKKKRKLILKRELTYGPGERGAEGEMYEESNTETYVIIRKIR